MAYTPNYSAGDISAVSVDLIVGIGAALVGFTALIGLILLYNWVRKKTNL